MIGQLYQNYLQEDTMAEALEKVEEGEEADFEEGEVDWDDFNNFMQAT